MVLLKHFQQHLLSVLVGNVPHHNRGAPVPLHLVHIDHVGLGLLHADRPPVPHRRRPLHVVVVVLRGHLHHHRHLSRGRLLSKPGRYRVGTVLGVLSDDSHA